MADLTHHPDPLIDRLKRLIRGAVRVLSVLMAFVIVLGVIDVGWVIWDKLSTPPYLQLDISEILATFGAFMAVLIAIEIFINITIYLREDVIHIEIVLATALMAIARKIVVLDTQQLAAEKIWGLAAIALAMSVGYYLVVVVPTRTRAVAETRASAMSPASDRQATSASPNASTTQAP